MRLMLIIVETALPAKHVKGAKAVKVLVAKVLVAKAAKFVKRARHVRMYIDWNGPRDGG